MKPSKLIKAMSLLSGMFSFLLAGCGGLPDDSSSAETPVSSVEEHVHVYDTENIEWSWNGYESATATFTCVDNDDTQVIDATITSEVTTDPVCESEGVRTYTATVTFKSETYTDQKIQSVDATGHVWDTDNIEWTWSDDHSMALATFTCMNDLNHTQKKTASVSSVTTESTCAAPGETTYTATVEFENNTYSDIQTEYIAPVDHDIDETTHTCSNCGYKDGLTIVLNDDGVSYSVTGIGSYLTYHGTDVEIPAYYNGLPVTEIGSYAFNYRQTITSISFASNSKLTAIGDIAFVSCTSLEKVTLPSSFTGLGAAVFLYCSALSEIISDDGSIYFDSESRIIYIKDTDASYHVYQYIGMEETDVTVPDTLNSLPVTGFGPYSFYYCSSLESITIPEGIESIGTWAFTNCTSLAKLTLPTTLASIGAGAFVYCTGLTEIVCENGLVYFDSENQLIYAKNSDTSYALIQCTGVDQTYPKIPSSVNSLSVTEIGETAFYSCSLYGIDVPESVVSIGAWAFGYCSYLADISIPESVTAIGEYAFYYCRSFTGFTLPESVTVIENHTFASCKSLTSIHIPEGVESIGDDAFYNCSSLESITLPEGIESIGDSVFRYCEALTGITIPEKVTSIGGFAFGNCISLTEIDIPDAVMQIGKYAFTRCTGLESIILPSSLESIGENAFANCTSLTYIFNEGSQYTLDYEFPYGTVYCYSEEEPATEGNWWHYVDGVPTVWETTTATE